MTDAVLNDDAGYYDISFNDSGDISTKDFFDTAILMSIFDEARADENEIPIPNLRRGWLGNETADSFEQGSKMWMFEQERVTGSVLFEIRGVIKKCLQWFVDNNFSTKITVDTPTLKNGAVYVNIVIFRSNSQPESRLYKLWDLTGK